MPPFAGRAGTKLVHSVTHESERPLRPEDSEKLGFNDTVWESLQSCWEGEPSARPSIDAVFTCLKQAAKTWVVDVPIFIPANEAGMECMINLKGVETKDCVDRLDKVRSCEIRSYTSIGVPI